MGRSELQYRKKKLKKRLGKIENNNYRKSKIYIEDQELIDFDEISYENEVAEFDWECKKVVIVDKLNPIVINEESNKFIDDLKNIWVFDLIKKEIEDMTLEDKIDLNKEFFLDK